MNEDFIRSIFVEFDGDKDGILTRSEAEFAAHSFGIADVNNFLKQFKSMDDGSIAIEEFSQKIKQMWVEEMNTEAFAKLFDHIDRDKSGALDLDEIKHMLDVFGIDVSDEELHEFFTAADLNRDGHIDTKEYIGFLRHLFNRQQRCRGNGRRHCPHHGHRARASTSGSGTAAAATASTSSSSGHRNRTS